MFSTRTMVAVMALAGLSFLASTAVAQSQRPVKTPQSHGRPFLQVDYGMTSPQFKDTSFDFKSIGLLEFKMGYAALDSASNGVISLWESYIFGGFASPDLGSSGGDDDPGSKFNRFGGASRFGRGYQGRSIGVDLINQDSLNWTRFTPVDYESADPEAQAIFDRYGSKYRYGAMMEAGLRVRFTESVALSAGLEGSVIYPRFVFWPWLGGVAIYSVVQGAVEYFGDEIVDANPRVGPVVYWLLKSGVALGYYMASRGDMNWPFDSETPLTLETFKLGATFKF